MHQLLKLIYRILQTGEHYREQGTDADQPADSHRTVRRLRKRLERLGYTVTPTSPPAA